MVAVVVMGLMVALGAMSDVERMDVRVFCVSKVCRKCVVEEEESEGVAWHLLSVCLFVRMECVHKTGRGRIV